MKRQAKERLPPIPSGREWLDVAWRDATAMAVPILESLPERVDDRREPPERIVFVMGRAARLVGPIGYGESRPLEQTPQTLPGCKSEKNRRTELNVQN